MSKYKQLFWPIVAALLLIGITYYNCHADIDTQADDKKQEGKAKVFECPKTHISDQDKCFVCHVPPTFAIKESDPHALRAYPNYYTAIYSDKQRKMLYARMKEAGLNSTECKEFFHWFNGRENMTLREASLFIDKFDQHLEKYQSQTKQEEG